jgi:serine kinase of HPr protein (carbohydrate metabolism regulator)
VNIRLSSETMHASCVALEGRAILLCGLSGSGKSDLALQLIDRGFTLVADDQTIVRKQGQRLLASSPTTIAGLLEIRGIGIVTMPTVTDVQVALVVELRGDIERMPDESRERRLLDLPVPLISIDATTASAASKVALALDRLGLPKT